MNIVGTKFRVSIFGESHGEAVGVVIDGVAPGISLCTEDFTADILRRKSGAKGTTPRIEADMPEIFSGVFEGHTTGAPLTIIFHNGNTRSADYSKFAEIPRPGHADYTASVKWDGQNDPRGGGHFSGRLTLPLVAAGVVAKKILALRLPGSHINAELVEIGGERDKTLWDTLLDSLISEQDSVGGIVECRAEGFPAGIGEPFFDSVEAVISHAIFSIPGVRGIEFGDGFGAARMKGSQHNDPFAADEDGKVITSRNGAGGVNGGILNGAPLEFRVAFKPTSSIGRVQRTLNMRSRVIENFRTPGRHDVCFALRTPVIVEAVTAIVLTDFIV